MSIALGQLLFYVMTLSFLAMHAIVEGDAIAGNRGGNRPCGGNQSGTAVHYVYFIGFPRQVKAISSMEMLTMVRIQVDSAISPDQSYNSGRQSRHSDECSQRTV